VTSNIFATKPLLPCQTEEVLPVSFSQVKIQEHNVDGLLLQSLQSVFDRPASADNFEVSLCSEEPSHTFPEQSVVIYQ
jgi:hypothetical protein